MTKKQQDNQFDIYEIDENGEVKADDEIDEHVKNEVQRFFYRPICSEKEIDRIMNVRNAKDYLLKFRADIIVENMRLFRVFRNRALRTANWTLEKAFDETHFKAVRKAMSWKNRWKCRKVYAGNIFSTDPNGTICSTEYGPIVMIDDSLRFFLEYINLGIMSFSKSEGVPCYIQRNALRIAIRIMLKTETLDFEMDPRGIIPKNVENKICSIIPMQFRFVTGHEFAHYILGHLKKNRIKSRKMKKSCFESGEKEELFYTIAQEEEFQADIGAIEFQRCNESEQKKLVEAALYFLAALSIYEAVFYFFSPPNDIPDHPPALDRFDRIAGKYVTTVKEAKKYTYLRTKVSALQKIMREDASLYCDNYEMYGSVYLDKPNTRWRGKELIDRVDYY